MKRFLAIAHLIFCIITLCWTSLTHESRNTYFRRVYSAVEQGRDPYQESLAGAEALAWHLFGPAIALAVSSMAVVILLLLPQRTK